MPLNISTTCTICVWASRSHDVDAAVRWKIPEYIARTNNIYVVFIRNKLWYSHNGILLVSLDRLLKHLI